VTYKGMTNIQVADAAHLGGNILEGDPLTYSPTVWDYLIRRFSLRSVMDLGSGIGHAAEYFFTMGVRVVAVEGLRQNVDAAVFPTIQHDLETGPVHTRVDLVHCQEVAEHIEERFVDNLIESMCCGRYILMTHALPGQFGHHHVNLKPPKYWTDLMAKRGCSLLIEDTSRVRKFAKADGAKWLAETGMLFANNAGLSS